MEVDQESLSFEEFGLSRTLLQGIIEKSWKVPSPVQKATLEAALNGQDILARAKNDAGVFLIPCIEMIDVNLVAIQALIIVSNCELATQAREICVKLFKDLKIEVMASIGTSGPVKQGNKLAFTPHILITLPERAVDFIEKGVAIVDQCKYLVLDEADKLPAKLLERLANHLPQQRQTLMFFDIFTIGVSEFAVKHLNNAYEFELKKAQSIDEMRCVAEYFEAGRDKRPLVSNERHVNDKNLSYYLYAVVKRSDNLQRSDVVKCGVTCDANRRWSDIVSRNKQINHVTHRMLILYKITVANLPIDFYSTHQYSRILERALFSFADNFSLVKENAKAGDGGTEDLLNQYLLTQAHIDLVAQLLTDSFANPRYVTSSDRRDIYECLKCGAIRFDIDSLTVHRKTCTGNRTINTSFENQLQPSSGIKHKAEVPKKLPGNQSFYLFYASVRDTTTWSDACEQWKEMSDNDKKPFKDQAAAELDQYYRDLNALGLKPEKKPKPEGAPPKPPRAYDLWLRDGNGKRIKEAKPMGKTNRHWFGKAASVEWNAFSDEAKQPYLDQHKALMEEYKVKYAEALEREENQE